MTALGRLFEPACVAVVRGSPTPGKAGHALTRSLERFDGDVYAVHPSAREVLGRPAYARVQDIPAPVDLALLAIPPAGVADALRDCVRAGVGAACVHAGGFAEAGQEGAALQAEAAAVARAGGLRLLGPNTSGFLNPGRRLCASFVPAAAEVPAGGLAIVAQSGGVNHALAFLAQSEGLGVRLAVGLGNAADVGFADVLEHLARDPGVAVVAIALEGVADGRALVHAVERVVERVPVVALKVGRTDVGAFAQSHTGALTGSFRVARAALAQAGAVVVDDTAELIDAARALSMVRLAPARAPGVGVVTGQAGPGLLLADALGAGGIEVPELPASSRERLTELLPPLTFQANPVDTGRPGPTFTDVLRAVADAEPVDLLAVYVLYEPEAVDLAEAVSAVDAPAVVATAAPPAQLAQLRERFDALRVPLYPTPERAARAVCALVADARCTHARRSAPAPGASRAGAITVDGNGWDEHRAKQLAGHLGIATPPRVVCASRQEAIAARERLVGPVAVKLLHPSLTHKTELGAVKLGIRDTEELERALDELAAVEVPAGALLLIEAMAASGPELLLGAVRDPAFGPVVLLGAGGTAAEVDDDVSVRLAPLSAAQAAGMLDELRVAPLARGHRGGPAIDEAQLVDAIVAVGDALAGCPAIAEIEMNPLRVTDGGLVALDAVVIPS